MGYPGVVWTTRDEVDFIRTLGQHTRGLFLGLRAELLAGYREGLYHRRVWAGLNRGQIVAAIEEEIRRCGTDRPADTVRLQEMRK